jgi:hypothetical protein
MVPTGMREWPATVSQSEAKGRIPGSYGSTFMLHIWVMTTSGGQKPFRDIST